jgi:hypothetical protein
MLICALAARHRLAIFTADTNFVRYAKILSLKPCTVGTGGVSRARR